MKDKNPILWGIDGDLKGREELIYIYLPFIKIQNRGIFVARRNTWDHRRGQHLKHVDWGEERAKECGTQIKMLFELPIRPGQMVSVMGPEFRMHLDALMTEDLLFHLPDDWYPIQQGFQISLISYAAYKKMVKLLAGYATHVFDEQITSRKIRHLFEYEISSCAYHARALLKGNPVVNLIEYTLREATMTLLEDEGGTEKTAELIKLMGIATGRKDETLLKKLDEYINSVGWGNILDIPGYPEEPCEEDL